METIGEPYPNEVGLHLVLTYLLREDRWEFATIFLRIEGEGAQARLLKTVKSIWLAESSTVTLVDS